MSDEERFAVTVAKMTEDPNRLPQPLRMSFAKDMLGPTGVRCMGHPNIFPNLWVSTGGNTAFVATATGVPLKREIWWFAGPAEGDADEMMKKQVAFITHLFGPKPACLSRMTARTGARARAPRAVSRRGPIATTWRSGLGQDEVLTDATAHKPRGNDHQ